MVSSYHSNLLGSDERGPLQREVIIFTSLKFTFAEGELVVIPPLPSEPMICFQGLFQKFQIVDEVT